MEVANVSYEVKINNQWITTVRHDSAHGYLHRHIRISLEDENDVINTISKQGNHHAWLTTAVEDLKTNLLKYRELFFERSGIIDTDNE